MSSIRETVAIHKTAFRANKLILSYKKPMLLTAFVFACCCVSTAQTAPKITGFLVDGVKSNRAAVGATLTIQGTGFGNSMGFSVATLAGTPLAGAGERPISWSNTKIVAVIPQTSASGPVIVNVSGRGQSNLRNLAVRVEITGVSTGSAPEGTGITVFGNGFGSRVASSPSTA
jgi:IPT/TIG domain